MQAPPCLSDTPSREKETSGMNNNKLISYKQSYKQTNNK